MRNYCLCESVVTEDMRNYSLCESVFTGKDKGEEGLDGDGRWNVLKGGRWHLCELHQLPLWAQAAEWVLFWAPVWGLGSSSSSKEEKEGVGGLFW